MGAAGTSLASRSLAGRLSGLSSAGSSRRGRWLPDWLLVLLGLIFGIVAALLIANGLWMYLVPLGAIIPATILFLRYPFVAVILWVVVFPYFVITPSPSFRLMYWLLHRAMIPAALVIVLLGDWLRLRRREPVRFGRAELAMLIFMLLTIANIFLLTSRPMPELIRFYDRLFVPFCMYWLVRLIAPGPDDLRRLAWAGSITIVIQTIIGMFGWFAPQVLPEQWLNRLGERTVGTFGNPAVFTSTLLFLALLLLHQGMNGQWRNGRRIALWLLALTYLSIFLSFSRGSWLGGVVVWIGLLFVYPATLRRWTIWGIVVGALLMSTILARESEWATARLGDQDTAEGRVLGAATAVRMIQQKPWLGWGFGTYDVYDERFKTRVADILARDEQTSHNTYLMFIAEMGVTSLVFYMFPAIWWLLLARKIRPRLQRQNPASWQLIALLWLLLIDHFIVSNFMDMIQSNLFGTTIWWLALGLIASQVYARLEPGDLGLPSWVHRSRRPAQTAIVLSRR